MSDIDMAAIRRRSDLAARRQEVGSSFRGWSNLQSARDVPLLLDRVEELEAAVQRVEEFCESGLLAGAEGLWVAEQVIARLRGRSA